MAWFSNNEQRLQAAHDAMAAKGVADGPGQTAGLDEPPERPVVDKIGQGFAGAGRMSGAWAEKWRGAANRAREDLAVNGQDIVDQRTPLQDLLSQLEL